MVLKSLISLLLSPARQTFRLEDPPQCFCEVSKPLMVAEGKMRVVRAFFIRFVFKVGVFTLITKRSGHEYRPASRLPCYDPEQLMRVHAFLPLWLQCYLPYLQENALLGHQTQRVSCHRVVATKCSGAHLQQNPLHLLHCSGILVRSSRILVTPIAGFNSDKRASFADKN